jgi:Gamma tubulin complex component N-terminal/Gamma tubulin complex component C-terminal
MLQEILLCLAGHPSPLLRETQAVDTPAKPDEHVTLLTPPERALLSTVAHLSDLHTKIKKHAASISTSHDSTICRAVASCITSQQLKKFMTRIVEVERSILSKDAGYVGGYGVVPLSAVVGEFAPWTRRLEWLWEVVQFMQPTSKPEVKSQPNRCTGSGLMQFLRTESHTGYTDLEEMALELVRTAEMVWMRQLSTWLLYGKLPNSGSEDFFIKPQPLTQDDSKLNLPEFSIQTDSVPDFVPAETASSIFFIGQSLNQARARDQSFSTTNSSADPLAKLLPSHLQCLGTIESPISSSSLTNVVASIRLSMSQNVLSQLLPLTQVFETLHVLQDYLLLGRGEFAMSLISNADRRMKNLHHGQDNILPIRKAGRLERLTIKDGDLAAVLNQTWSELVALETEEDLLDGSLEKARDLLRIVTQSPMAAQEADSVDFSSLMFSVPTSFTLSLPPRSPLNLFLTRDDIASYSVANSYLLSLRRAEMHLACLWKHSSLRRLGPCPGGSSFNSYTVAGRHKVAERRKREDRRNLQMRRYWAIASKSQFVLSEFRGYFEGEIVQGHSAHFSSWLGSLQDDDQMSSETRPVTSTSAEQSSARRGIGMTAEQFKISQSSAASDAFRRSALNRRPRQSDPATLAKAHQRHLTALRSSLLLNAEEFTKALLRLLRLLDHFVALFGRLEATQQHLDLKVDERVIDALANHTSDEHDILQELERSRSTIEQHLKELVKELRRSVDHAPGPRESDGQSPDGLNLGASSYTPWRAPSVDALLMKLESIGAKPHVETETEDEDEDERYYSE